MNTTLVNTCDRPVELHLADAVVVVEPRSRVECGAQDLALGQVRELCRRGVLAVLPTAPVAAQPVAARKPPRRGAARQKRTAPRDQG
jgi:hypothetical protein